MSVFLQENLTSYWSAWVKTSRGWTLQRLENVTVPPICGRLTPRDLRDNCAASMSVFPQENLAMYGSAWVKTPRGWTLQRLEDVTVPPICDRLTPRPDLVNISKEVSLARNVLVTGMKGQRKVSVCLSEFLKHMDIKGAVSDIRRKSYLFDLMHLFMKDNLAKMSGTAHRELFVILEMMCNEALQSEYCVHKIRSLLACSLQSCLEPGQAWIGSRKVLNRYIQLIQNLTTKLDKHHFYEREDDDQLQLMDLPKECLRHVIFLLEDHKDIIHISQTCDELHEISSDNLMWERLTQRYFTEKQMLTFVNTQDIDDTLPWKQMYRKCFKKYGTKKTYTDGLVICSACKTLHWMLGGHTCWCSEESREVDTYLDPVSPEQLMPMLNL